jgi:hypothetical protein
MKDGITEKPAMADKSAMRPINRRLLEDRLRWMLDIIGDAHIKIGSYYIPGEFENLYLFQVGSCKEYHLLAGHYCFAFQNA